MVDPIKKLAKLASCRIRVVLHDIAHEVKNMIRLILVAIAAVLLTFPLTAQADEFFRCTAHLEIRYKNEKLVQRDVSRDVRAATNAAAEAAVRIELSKITESESSRILSPVVCVPIADAPNSAPWKCTVRGNVNGAPKKWAYDVAKYAKRYRSDAERWASAQFVRDFDGNGGAVARDSVNVFCDDSRLSGQPTGQAKPSHLSSGAWTCKVAMQWAAIDSTGALRKGWYGGSIENVSGQTEGNALGLAYAATQNKWAGMDGAGMRRVVWSLNTGRCWTSAKPTEPIGWPRNKYPW